jgi:aspartate racemase
MNTLGIIGGLSWQSTQTYYSLINQGIATRLGGYHSAKMIIYSLDFAEIERYQAEGRWDEIGEMLATAAVALEKAGADFLLLATNTMHKVASKIIDISNLPLIHIADVTAAAIKQLGITKIGLLGTRITMEQDFYHTRLNDTFRIRIIVPDEKDRVSINEIIYKELTYGEIKDASRQRALEIIENLVAMGAHGIILGCTELPLLISSRDINVPLFDTTALHATAAVEMMLEDK